MKSENKNRPLGSYLLRVFEEREERVRLRYELLTWPVARRCTLPRWRRCSAICVGKGRVDRSR